MYIKGTVLIGLVTMLVSACLTAPEFPNEPSLSFNNIIFKKGGSEFSIDTLILTMNFRDGDGDLGLNPDGDDLLDPFHEFWVFTKDDGSGDYVTLADFGKPGFEILPPYEFPYSCINYSTIIENDTFYTEPNIYHHNIYVDFFVKKNGIYTEFDWSAINQPACNPNYDGRFPLLNESLRDRPLEGKLKYKMQSVGFDLLFRDDSLKLEFYIYDRAHNKSNVVSTPDFVLKSITVGG